MSGASVGARCGMTSTSSTFAPSRNDAVSSGGMFQVADLRDENDADRTELVDQGKHYSTLEELAADIARRLGVPVSQVEVA